MPEILSTLLLIFLGLVEYGLPLIVVIAIVYGIVKGEISLQYIIAAGLFLFGVWLVYDISCHLMGLFKHLFPAFWELPHACSVIIIVALLAVVIQIRGKARRENEEYIKSLERKVWSLQQKLYKYEQEDASK